MPTRARSFVFLTLIGVAVALGQEPEREPWRGTGKLRGIAPGVLQIETESGERMLVAIDSRSQEVSFQGMATPAFVQAGMLIQFQATIDKKGEAQEEIQAVKVLSPRMGLQVGVQAEGGLAGGQLFASEEEAPKKKKRTRNDSAAYVVTGIVRSIKDGKMYVAAGPVVKAELADNCQIELDVADLRFAREGDSVEVKDAWRYPNQANQIYARGLTVTAEKILDPDAKRRRPTAKSGEKDAAEDAANASNKDKDKDKDKDDSKDGDAKESAKDAGARAKKGAKPDEKDAG